MSVRNVLLITVDDLNWNTPGCFSDLLPDVTPRIDGLAAEGMCFDRAHVTVAVCLPSRSVLMTGRYPHRNGSEGFSPMRPELPTMPELLKEHGWRIGILGKVTHCSPPEKFGWDCQVDMPELGWGRDPQRYASEMRDFIEAADAADQPFFLMANSHDPHRPFHGSEQERQHFDEDQRALMATPSRVYTPDEVRTPGFLPDLPDVRLEVAEYCSSARRCDDTIGAFLDTLAATGHAEDTVVLFLSDNGMAFPFAKTNCYLHSTRTPLIIRWPGVTAGGQREREHYVSGIDILPTIFDGLGLELPADVDGRSALPILRGMDQAGRERVFTVFHETAGKRRYEMRCVQEGGFGYIYNAWADGSYEFKNESQNGRTMAAMRAAASEDPAIAARVQHFLYRCPEELYDFEQDPDALHNLAGDPTYADRLMDFRHHLSAWMEQTSDHLIEDFRQFAGLSVEL